MIYSNTIIIEGLNVTLDNLAYTLVDPGEDWIYVYNCSKE